MGTLRDDPVVHAFLTEHLRTILFSRRADGSPGGHPMSAFYGDDGLFFNTYAKSAKARNMQRDPRVTCLVTPFGEASERQGVVVRGDVRFVPVDEEQTDVARQGLTAARTSTPVGAAEELDALDPEESARRKARAAQRVAEGKRLVIEVVPVEVATFGLDGPELEGTERPDGS